MVVVTAGAVLFSLERASAGLNPPGTSLGPKTLAREGVPSGATEVKQYLGSCLKFYPKNCNE